tara:strand:- start:1922 stop:2365 length:444 start_codon:yes stop_codon:yes gene_type:complete
MAITTAMCNSFKGEILGGTHDLVNDTIKLALIKETPTGTYNADTENYSDVTGNSDEASGTGYSAGGQTVDNISITVDDTNDVAFVDINDEVFSDVTTSVDGCIIYNSSQGNKAIAVIDFGGTVSATAGDLTIEFPAAAHNTAIIRIA